MDIKSLQEKLNTESEWRKRELHQAYALFENSDSEAKNYLARVWVLVMYAHCDNFLKESANLCLSYAKENDLNGYKPELLWLIRNAKVMDSSKYRTPSNYAEDREDIFVANFSSLKDKSFQYNFLRFVFDWVLQLDYAHDEMQNFCNELKKKRDAIAHGELQYPEEVDCLRWHKATIEFIDTFADCIINRARDSLFA